MNMNSRQNIFFVISIYFTLFLNGILIGQDIPLPSDHSVHKYIDRHITLGNISQKGTSIRPYTYSFVRDALNQLSEIEQELLSVDRDLLNRFRIELTIAYFDESVEFPLSKDSFTNLGKVFITKYEEQKSEPHFLSYNDSDIFAWVDLNERIGLQTVNETAYRRFTDRVSIIGSISNELSFLIDFTMNRFVGDSSLVHYLDDYKNEDNPYFDFVNWTLWYQSNAAFNISTKYGLFQLAKTPVIWGFSPNNSPILSGANQTFPFLSYSFRNDFFSFNFLHGTLLPYRSTEIHRLHEYPRKYLTGHRLELYLGEKFTFSFNELVIYGNRPLELEYLIPVNFYWPAEHNLGDKDNVLMALDCSWLISPGLRWYNTLFWDELAWEKVLSKWWGNKYVLQGGIHWISKSNPYLLELRVEGTIARPWTYTHGDFTNSYSSAEIGLGLPQGPNSQSLLVEAGLWPSYRWKLNLKSMYLIKGIELGSSVLDNYNDRDDALDEDTPFLLGEVKESFDFKIESTYEINRLIELSGWLSYNTLVSEINGFIGITFDW